MTDGGKDISSHDEWARKYNALYEDVLAYQAAMCKYCKHENDCGMPLKLGEFSWCGKWEWRGIDGT